MNEYTQKEYPNYQDFYEVIKKGYELFEKIEIVPNDEKQEVTVTFPELIYDQFIFDLWTGKEQLSTLH